MDGISWVDKGVFIPGGPPDTTARQPSLTLAGSTLLVTWEFRSLQSELARIGVVQITDVGVISPQQLTRASDNMTSPHSVLRPGGGFLTVYSDKPSTSTPSVREHIYLYDSALYEANPLGYTPLSISSTEGGLSPRIAASPDFSHVMVCSFFIAECSGTPDVC